RGEEAPLPPALGEEAGGDLEGGHAAAVRGLEQPDLGEGERELARPDREEQVEHVGEAVVHEVGERADGEDGGGPAHGCARRRGGRRRAHAGRLARKSSTARSKAAGWSRLAKCPAGES